MWWGEGEKILITLMWRADKYGFTYTLVGSGTAGDLYTPELLEEVLTVCGMRQFYLPPSGGQVEPPTGQTEHPSGQTEHPSGQTEHPSSQVEIPSGQRDNNVTCPALPTDPKDCTIPRLSNLRYDPYARRGGGKVKCQGLAQLINDGLRNIDRKRGGKPPIVTEKFRKSSDFCVPP